ncbi:YwdI family protein [Sporosarcina oncorhynchi]|uniref:YwdI family protein n=1 Tax=Sporosarcina oncorhynchi TaxID=3056444 RepID=A0ABZ0L728_9BACL|nr:YwdI family protein [Sporosarcina sp. T2O-4]WOV87935.1 YwdI family protein [Sporosarcina sp. T2O-4]
MIATERILVEMDRQLALAKEAGNEQAMREALTAIRSLCQVVLGSGEVPQRTASVNRELTVASMGQQPTPSQVVSLDSKPLIEKDANGGSIFDF